MSLFVAKRMFLTKGVGYHRNKLQSFELALRDADIEVSNLVVVSSILPPECRIVPKKAGIEEIKPGAITFCVLAREETNEPYRRAFAAVGIARPVDRKQYGYISEHHGFGQTQKQAGDHAEDLAATMLASTLGIEIDADSAWDERKQLYVVGNKRRFTSRSIAQTVVGHPKGLWTSVVACAVMLLD